MSAEFATDTPGISASLPSRNPIWAVLGGSLAALPVALWLWGFTVDDALITVRVARHLARGLGPRFNPNGPVTDAVTPLGYAQLLSLFARGDALPTLAAAKALGLVAWLAAAGLLGALVARTGRRPRRFAPLLVVALNAPLAAWAVSGMETGLVTLLVTVGLLETPLAALALGLAAAWRPELVPFAVALTLTRSRRALRLFLLSAPLLLVAAARFAEFGRVVPLSFYAKPSDFEHGLRYALGAFAFTGLPWLLVGRPRAGRGLFVALAAHFAALVLCGGDWMTLYRLLVPVLPAAALAGAHLAEQGTRRALALRLCPALLSSLVLGYFLAPVARRVGADRAALIAQARPLFAHDTRIAALDVGWVGAASEAEVLDLAGVTDSQVAFFPGGHTSKQIPKQWLYARRPSAVVLLIPNDLDPEGWQYSNFSRAVEQRVAHALAEDYRVRGVLRSPEQTYLVIEPKP